MTYWAALLFAYICSFSQKKQFVIALQIILFIMAAFAAPDVSHDYQNYINGYYNSSGIYFPETFSRLIFNGAKVAGMDVWVSFFIFALISMSLKWKAIKNLQIPASLFFLLYFSKLFLLMDLTQVRAAISVALCLLSFDSLINNNKSRAFLYILIAFFFHLSSVMFLPVLFMSNKRPNAIIWMMAFCFGIFISFLNIKLVLLKLIITLHAPENYLTYLDDSSGITVNPFNILIIVNVFIFLMFCLYDRVLNEPLLNLAFKLYGISIISFYVFIDFPVLCFRISEFFLVYQIILLCGLYNKIKPGQKKIYITFLFCFSALQLYITYNKAAIIEPYVSRLF